MHSDIVEFTVLSNLTLYLVQSHGVLLYIQFIVISWSILLECMDYTVIIFIMPWCYLDIKCAIFHDRGKLENFLLKLSYQKTKD